MIARAGAGSLRPTAIRSSRCRTCRSASSARAAARDERPRGGVAIGDMILDLRAALGAGLFSGDAAARRRSGRRAALNPLMALGPEPRRALRRQVFALLDADGPGRAKAEPLADQLLHRAADCWLHLPAAIGNFTDFFAGIHHAANGGRRRDPNNPLSPNYKYVPVAYHSRASSVRESNVPVRRPNGQRKAAERGRAELTARAAISITSSNWRCGSAPAIAQGEPIPIGAGRRPHFRPRADQRLVGARHPVLGMPPLGPFLGKNFGSTVSPWIVTAEALEPFRVAQPPRPDGDPRPLPYLWDDRDQQSGAFDIALEALILTAQMREKGQAPHRMSREQHDRPLLDRRAARRAPHLQRLQPAARRLFGSGTISGPTDGGLWQPQRTEPGRHAHDHPAQRRDPHLSRKRRRGDLPRPIAGATATPRSASASAAPASSPEHSSR